MRFVSWNIQQGGGSRVERILRQLESWDADIAGLCEFRGSASSQEIAQGLASMGLAHQATTSDSEDRNRNGLLLASRWPIESQPTAGVLQQTRRWLHVKVKSLDVMLMHVPNRDEDDYHGIPGVKYETHDRVIESFQQLRGHAAIAFGDTNSGQIGIDESSSFFNKREHEWFTRINESGWIDVWRSRYPEEREYTWHTGSGDDAGFRLDQLFATCEIEPRIRQVRHDWGDGGRAAKLSDHAALVFELDE